MKRFWTETAVVGTDGPDPGWEVRLDSRPVRTPAKRACVLPSRDLADRVAAEWEAQVETVDPRSMPMTTDGRLWKSLPSGSILSTLQMFHI